VTERQILDRIRLIVTQYGDEYFGMDMVSQDRHGAEYFELLYTHLMMMVGEIDE